MLLYILDIIKLNNLAHYDESMPKVSHKYMHFSVLIRNYQISSKQNVLQFPCQDA